MKLKKLTIKNINSLFGTWEINFEDEAFSNNSIFAIVGKNGSGKSTILDAISLALYDKTVRLNLKGDVRVSYASHGTKEAMASLVFELNGIEYTSQLTVGTNGKTGEFKATPDKNATWIQWRDRDGVLQKVEGTDEKVKTVQNILGLRFEQFCQVILLAQGKFNAFLAASSEERTSILEKITNTEIYRKVGGVVREKKNALKNDLALSEKKLEGIRETLLSEDVVLAKQNRIREINQEKTECEGNLKVYERLLKASESLSECVTLLTKKTDEGEALRGEEEEFAKNDAGRLATGLKAAEVTPAYNAFTKQDNEQHRLQEALDKLRTDTIPERTRAEIDCRYLYDGAEEVLRNAKCEQNLREKFLADAETLDREITAGKKQIVSCKKELQTSEINKGALEKEIKKLEEEIKSLNTQKTSAEEYCRNHSQDAGLAAKHSGWIVTKNMLDNTAGDLLKERSALAKLGKKVEKALDEKNKAVDDVATKQKAGDQAQDVLTKAQGALDAALGGKTLQELLDDLTEQGKVVTLLEAVDPKALLQTFSEGEACPVCGATHHPNRGVAMESFPDLEKARARQVECQTKYDAAKSAKETWGNANSENASKATELNNAKALLTNKESAYHDLKAQYADADNALKSRQERYRQDVVTLQAELSEFGFVWDGVSELPAAIQARQNAYKAQSDALAGFEANRNQLLAKKSGKEGEWASKNDECSRMRGTLQSLEEGLAQKDRARKNQYGDLNDIPGERKALEGKVSIAQRGKENSAVAYSEAKTELHSAEREARNLEEKLQSLAVELSTSRQTLNEALAKQGLDLPGYQNGVLEPLVLNELTAKKTSLEGRRSTLTREIGQLESRKAEAQKVLPAEFDEAETREKQSAAEEKKQSLSEELGGINADLENNRRSHEQSGELLREIEQKERVLTRWDCLDGWIGGDNFCNRAQRYTFSVLMAKANEQIKTMLGGRYSLCPCNTKDDMSIQVYDELLGGDMRTSANLSGGEQFVVSLALALGLSEMVGQKFQVDSLFLDEGFGTLDNDELEKAVAALSSLTSRGKLVGVISHVEHLQSAISTKIKLTKKGNGRSVLEGPGIQKLQEPEMFVSKEEKASLAEAAKEAKKAEREAKRAKREAEKAEKEAKKAKREAEKAEKEASKAASLGASAE